MDFLNVNIWFIIVHLREEGTEENHLRWPIDIDPAL